MDLERLKKHQKALARSGVRFVDGLTAGELADLEVSYGFSFPTDLRTFLMFALPVSDRFVDWRNATTEQVNDSLRWLLDGICFDIEHNDFWPNDWGTRPDALPQAFAIAAQRSSPFAGTGTYRTDLARLVIRCFPSTSPTSLFTDTISTTTCKTSFLQSWRSFPLC